MSEELSNKVVRHHADLVADLLRLAVPDAPEKSSFRMTQLRNMIICLEQAHPELEQRRVTLMSPQEL